MMTSLRTTSAASEPASVAPFACARCAEASERRKQRKKKKFRRFRAKLYTAMRMMARVMKGESDEKESIFDPLMIWDKAKVEITEQCLGEASAGRLTPPCHPKRYLDEYRKLDMREYDRADMHFRREFDKRRDSGSLPELATHAAYVDRTEIAWPFATPMAQLDVVAAGFLTSEDLLEVPFNTVFLQRMRLVQSWSGLVQP